MSIPFDTPAEELARLAAERPDLWEEISVHPNVYPDLQRWIAENLEAEAHADQGPVHGAYGVAQDSYGVVQDSYGVGEWSQPAQPYGYQSAEQHGFSDMPTEPYNVSRSDPNAEAPARAPQQTGKSSRRKSIAFIAGGLAVALALGGGGAALALTDTWPFGPDGLFGNDAASAAEVDAGPSFGAGVEAKWTLTTDDLGNDGYMSSLPRMMVNYIPRTEQPLQIDGAVVFQSGKYQGAEGGSGASLTVVDSVTGEVTWEDSAVAVSCAPGDGTTEVICALGYVEETDLISITNEGVFDIASVDGFTTSLLPADTGYVLGGPGAIKRVNAEGKIEWSSESIDAEYTEQLQVAGEYVLGVSADSWRIIGAGGKTLAEASGLDSTNLNGNDRCDFMLTEQKLLMIGTACDDTIGIDGLEVETVSNGSALSVGLLEGRDHRPWVWLHSSDAMTTAYDARSGDELWSVMGIIPGWFQEPALVIRDGDDGDGVLLVDGEDIVVQSVTGGGAQSTRIDGANPEGEGRMLAVVGGTVLAFDGDEDRVLAYDGATGDEISEGVFPEAERALEAIGGRNGALLGLPKCTDCSTAEGSSIIVGYTFYGPVSGASGEAARTQTAGVAVPDFIPDCPESTTLLAWAELDDGWVLVCGISPDEPTYVAYQMDGGAKPVYSLGSGSPTGAEARAAVYWDDRLGRYTADLADGGALTLDYDIGTITIRDASDTRTLEQKRLVRYLFVIMGDKIRTVQDASDDDGAFEVKAPKDTAEDQIRYMIEVLEKAYDGRALVKDALPKLQYCTASAGGYGDTVAAMQAVRDNRSELLDALSAMPVDKIPEGQALLDDLTAAIRYSYQANVEYVAWAEAAHASGCASLSSAGQSAAAASDAPKERFASRWNSVVAPRYGVRTFDAWYI